MRSSTFLKPILTCTLRSSLKSLPAMSPPKIFISATSGDLSSARQIAKEALLTINCHPVEQTNFEPDWRSVTDMLRGKIGDCQALIHLVGFRYGAEPDPASLPPGTPHRSYTQMEYHLARERGLRVYTFLLPETYPFDVPAKADTPEQTQLQAAHRALIQSSPHLYEKPADDLDLRTRLIALQEQVISLVQEQKSIASEVKTARHWGVWAAAAFLLLLGSIGYWQWGIKQETAKLNRIGDTVESLFLNMGAKEGELARAEEGAAFQLSWSMMLLLTSGYHPNAKPEIEIILKHFEIEPPEKIDSVLANQEPLLMEWFRFCGSKLREQKPHLAPFFEAGFNLPYFASSLIYS